MTAPTLFWFRRDLRLADNPGLTAALQAGGPVIPVVIRDSLMDDLGAAPKWRMEQGLKALARALDALGSKLIFRQGEALEVLGALAAETGARAVHWGRLYDPDSIARDKTVKAGLQGAGIEAVSHAGHLLFEPWTVETGQGGHYKVYTPYWKAVRARDPGAPVAAPSALPAPETWPAGDDPADWRLGAGMQRGAAVVSRYARVGEDAAQARLEWFLDGPIAMYAADRDKLARDGTSGLSQNFALGEISVRQAWAAGHRAMEEGAAGAETFLRELVWRDFAYHLLYHTPRIATENWRPEWDAFPWQGPSECSQAWQRGRTGEPVIDAAMREMYVTGTMHNRARMLAASYLTKHLMTHWRVGQKWFEECLIDWDPASNAMGWQWAAGSGPDASPYFRIFNPATQAEKFDPRGSYRRRYVAELDDQPGEQAREYFQAIPKSWSMQPNDPYPSALVDLKAGRERALAAYQDHRTAQSAS